MAKSLPPRIVTNFVEVTSALARTMLGYKYERQRDEQDTHAAHLTMQHRLGQLHGDVITIMVAILDSVPYMINGRHTCEAIVAADKPLWTNIRTIVCTTMQEIDAMYSVADHNLPRKPIDTLRARGAIDDDEFSKPTVRVIMSAVRLLILGFRRTGGTRRDVHQLSKDDTVLTELFKEYKPLAHAFYGHLHKMRDKSNVTLFNSSGILAVFIACYQHAREDADKFWPLVFNPTAEASDLGDPRRTLREYLLKRGVGDKPPDLARYVASPWNMFCAKKPLERIVIREQTFQRPLYLAKTPYDGVNYVFPHATSVDFEAWIRRATNMPPTITSPGDEAKIS
jgi:hypothetical protein